MRGGGKEGLTRRACLLEACIVDAAPCCRLEAVRLEGKVPSGAYLDGAQIIAAAKAIGAAARAEIAAAIEQPVHLFLFVKVREGWGDDPERYREMGLEFPNE